MPEALYSQLEALSERRGESMNKLVATAVAALVERDDLAPLAAGSDIHPKIARDAIRQGTEAIAPLKGIAKHASNRDQMALAAVCWAAAGRLVTMQKGLQQVPSRLTWAPVSPAPGHRRHDAGLRSPPAPCDGAWLPVRPRLLRCDNPADIDETWHELTSGAMTDTSRSGADDGRSTDRGPYRRVVVIAHLPAGSVWVMSGSSCEAIATVVRQVLSVRGPMAEDDLLAALVADGIDLGPDPDDMLTDVLDQDAELVMPLADERWAWIPAVLGGRIFTHRLSAWRPSTTSSGAVPIWRRCRC